MKKEYGFSLIELMIAVVIATLLAAIAIPSYNDMIARNRLSTQGNDLTAGLQFARSEAIRLNRNIVLCRTASATSDTCASGSNWEHWIVRDNANPTNPVLRRGSVSGAGTSLKLTSSLTNHRITFRSTGIANANNGTLTLCTPLISSGNINVLNIRPTGRVVLEKQSGAC